jgi:hypothetical protein
MFRKDSSVKPKKISGQAGRITLIKIQLYLCFIIKLKTI